VLANNAKRGIKRFFII